MRYPIFPKRRTALAATVIALASTACSGPLEPLDIATRPLATDIALGAKLRAVAGAPLPPSVFTIGARRGSDPFPILEALPRPLVGRGPRASCPSATQPGPKAAANNTVLEPPKPGAYRYDVIGAELVGVAARAFPTSSVHTVRNIAVSPIGTFTFDVAADLGGQTTVSTYRVVPLELGTPPVGDTGQEIDELDGRIWTNGPPVVDIPNPEKVAGIDQQPSPALPTESGLSLAALQRPGSAVPVRFREGGVRIVTFPITVGQTFRSTATDGVVTFDYTSKVTGKEVVNACEALIAVWRVVVTGTMASPSEATVLPFKATFDVAPQYGGLIVRSQTNVGILSGGAPGVDSGQPVLLRLLEERIAQEPALLASAT